MKPRERNIATGGLIVGLLIGLLVGAIGGGNIFGTAGGDEKEDDNKSDDKAASYYLLSLDETEAWLMETYGEKGLDEDMLTTTIEGVRAIEQTDDDFRKIAVDNEQMMEDLLTWSQAALNGVEEIKADEEIVLSKDLAITACLALDDDPWTTDPEYARGVKLYVEVPEGEDKSIPKEWEKVEPKSDTNLFWIPLQCNPDPNAEDDK